MMWSRLDSGAKWFVTTKKYCIRWDMVTRRVTRDMNTGDVVQGIYVEHSDFKQYPGFLHTLLPKGIWYIRAIL